MNSLLFENVKKLGLTDKEAQVYLACVEMGTGKLTHIAHRANVKRPTAYLIIGSLISKNFISRLPKGKIDHYKPNDPKFILNEQIERVEIAKAVLPELSLLYKSHSPTKITHYEGKKQCAYAHELLFRSQAIFSLVDLEAYWQVFGEKHNRHIYSILRRSGGISYLLIPKTKKTMFIVGRPHRKGLQNIRLLPEGFRKTKSIGMSFNEKLLFFFSHESLTATVIEDPNLLATYKEMYEFIWNQSEPFS